MKIAINGFGRIGRCILRSFIENDFPKLELCKINSTQPMEQSLHLLEYDSIFGKFPYSINVLSPNSVEIRGQKIDFICEKNPENIDWSGIDMVMECTGKFTSQESASVHLKSGAKMVMISAPAKEKGVPTVVLGVNNASINSNLSVFSIGSCTTNCLAPVAKVLDDKFGILSGFMTTIHSYTGDQNIVDGSHKDPRRARSAATSMVPTSTGAAKALSAVLPNLEGKLDGSAIRVPTPNVSVIDLVVNLAQDVTKDAVNQAFIEASESPALSGILGVESKPLVSIDFVKSPFSSNIDLLETQVVAGRCARVLAWYDNEWAFSTRMLDIASILENSN